MRKHFLSVNIIATMMLLGTLLAAAQTRIVIDVLEDADNTILLQLSSKDGIDKPDKILFVYDSNIITLKSTESDLSVNKKVHSSYKTKPYTYSSSENFVLAAEIEQEMQIESWMLRPFKKEYFAECLIPQKEEEMAIEPWMKDLTLWKLQ